MNHADRNSIDPTRSRADAVADRRPAYQADLARGLDRFFEPRRTTCPWCGSTRLREHLRTPDLYQHKPGQFSLDRCEDCRHVFQNPRLSAEGLAFYYRDFYDGLGEKVTGKLFAGKVKTYQRRAASLLPFAPAPRDWLDVGSGHGHFCETARTVLPNTNFDGLDFSDGAKIAERAGRVRTGYSGSFVELAPEIAAHYDVVSMFHYLEHTIEPERDLRAAHLALRPGGHLIIEVPDPDSHFARLLGKWWGPWLQPQHLHFAPIDNLRHKLSSLGFTVLAEQRAEPHIPVDLLGAVWFALSALAPREDMPWLPRPQSKFRTALRVATFVLGLPALLLSSLLDWVVIKPLSHRPGWSNTYRLLARRD